jgi:hypothetical protein
VSLDPDNDPFWRKHAHWAFPDAIEAHEQELAAVIAREQDIRRSAGGGGPSDEAAEAFAALGEGGAPAADGGAAGGGSDLVSAIDSLPALLRRKKNLETHTYLLHAVMARVAARAVPHFFDAEANAAAARGGLDKKATLAMVADGAKGSFYDRVRLAAIYLLSCTPTAVGGAAAGAGTGTGAMGGMASATMLNAGALAAAMGEECMEMLGALRSSLLSHGGAAVAPQAQAQGGEAAVLSPAGQRALDRAASVIAYIRHIRTTPGGMGAGLGGGTGVANAVGAGLANLASKMGAGGKLLSALTQTTSSLLTRATATVTRALQGGDQRLPLTRVVQAVCEGKPSLAPQEAGVESFLVLDPRSSKPGERPYAAYLAACNAVAAGTNAEGGGGSAAAAATAAGLNPRLCPATFRNAFVFVVGGGCYSEYHDLMAYGASAAAAGSAGGVPGGGSGAVSSGAANGANSTNAAAMGGAPGGSCIVYGSTEIVHPEAFLGELTEMGAAFV